MNIRIHARTMLAGFGCMVALDAGAVPIEGLFNTGASSAPGGADTNYALTKTGGDGPGIGFFGFEGIGLNPAWIPNSATSQWLTPHPSANLSFDAASNGTYIYTLVFDLTGFDAETAVFDGRWSTDNSGVMFLNGTALSNPSGGFFSWTDFSSAGATFLDGLNTIEFVVTNFAQASGNPTGVRVEFLNSDVDVTAVPEPGTLALLGIGLVGAGLFRRRRHTG